MKHIGVYKDKRKRSKDIKQTDERPIDRRVFVRRMLSGLRRGYPFSSIVVTPEELKSRLEIGDQFFEEIVTRGEVLYAK